MSTRQNVTTKSDSSALPVSMCELCERVPVPVYFINHSGLRGLYLCARCLAEDGIHISEGEDS